MSGPKVLDIFDFDGTLFRTPVPDSENWDYLSYSLLLDAPPFGLGFFQSLKTLSPPYVPESPSSAWFNLNIVEAARKSSTNPDHFTILLTGRAEIFRQRVTQIIKGINLNFDLIDLKPEPYSSTIDYKISEIEDILAIHPTIQEINIWEDRPSQIQEFSKFLESKKRRRRITSYRIHEFLGESTLPFSLEAQLIKDLIEEFHFNYHQNKKSKWILKTNHVSAGLLLTDESSDILKEKFPPQDGWVTKAHRLLLCDSKIPAEFIDEMGGIGSEHTFKVISHSKTEDIEVVEVEGIPSIISQPIILLSTSPKHRGPLTTRRGRRLEEPFELKGALQYFSKLQIVPSDSITRVEIGSSDIGRIIGKQGSTISQLRDAHNLKIDLEKDDTPRGTRIITLIGALQERNKCINQIKRLCWSAVVLSNPK